jgi:hypothetical protein
LLLFSQACLPNKPCLKFNLGHNYINSVTVTDGHRRVQWDKNTWLHNSFIHERGRIARPVIKLTSISIVSRLLPM